MTTFALALFFLALGIILGLAFRPDLDAAVTRHWRRQLRRERLDRNGAWRARWM